MEPGLGLRAWLGVLGARRAIRLGPRLLAAGQVLRRFFPAVAPVEQSQRAFVPPFSFRHPAGLADQTWFPQA